MDLTVQGGGNLVEITPVDSDFLPTSNWPTGTGSDLDAVTPPFKLTNIKSSAHSGHPNTKDVQVDLSQYKFDPELTQFFNQYLTDYTAPSDEYYEDGEKVGASLDLDEGEVFLIKSYGKKTSSQGALVRAFLARLDGGDFTYENNSFVAEGTTLISVAAPTTINITSTDINSTYVKTAATMTIAADSYGRDKWQ